MPPRPIWNPLRTMSHMDEGVVCICSRCLLRWLCLFRGKIKRAYRNIVLRLIIAKALMICNRFRSIRTGKDLNDRC